MADKTLTVTTVGEAPKTLTFNRDRFAGVRTMTRVEAGGATTAITVNRTASSADNGDKVGQSRPLLSKVVGGASAAYSLRDLNDKANTSKVVRVRRESDNNERDFNAKEVSNGTLQNWTNAQVTPPLDLRELTATGRDGPIIEAAAAYSLRNLSDSYTGSVVEVRRTSDNAVRSFTATEVADGTLEDWVNEALNIKTYDFSTNAGGLGFTNNITLEGGESAGGVDDALKMSVVSTGTNSIHRCYQNISSIGSGSSLRITFRAYRPSSNINSNKLGFSFASGFLSGNISAQFFSADDAWEEFTFYSNSGTSTRFYIQLSATNGAGSLKSVFNGTTGDHVFIKDLSIDVVSSTGTVSKWYDQSTTSGVPNAKHAVQTSTGSQPKIVDAGSLVSGGLDFDVDRLNLPSEIITASSHSLFAVARTSTTSSGGPSDYPQFLADNTSGKGFGFFANGLLDKSAGSSNSLGLFSFTSNTFEKLMSVTSDNSIITAFQDGVASASNPIAESSTSNKIDRLGGSEQTSEHFDGTIQEIIIYTSDQSDNRTAIEANIGEVYGIAGIPAYEDTVNGFVETWYDQSGNGNDATQLTAGSQPKIVDAGVLVSGGILSDGAGTFLELDSTLISDEFDIFFTGTATASNWTSVQRAPYGFNTNSDYPRFNDDSFRYTISSSDSGTTNYNSGFTIGAGTPFLYNFNRDVSDSVGAQINGTAQTNRVTLIGTHQISQLFRRGANTSQVWDGTMSEMIFYPSDQSANRPAIEANINNQYDIY